MKWKRKSGCLRAEAHGVLFKLDGLVLVFRDPAGGWSEASGEFDTVEAAKARAEEIASIYDRLATLENADLARRRDLAAKEAMRDPQEKALLKLWAIWERFSNMERFAARRLRPDMKHIFDAFDKILSEPETLKEEPIEVKDAPEIPEVHQAG